MNIRSSILKLSVLAVLAGLVGAGLPAAAGPKTAMRRDRNDNTYSFEYNSVNGSIDREQSGHMIDGSDVVDYFVYVRRSEAGPGAPLTGLVELHLIKKGRRVVYDGEFSFTVRSLDGNKVYADEVPAQFRLGRKNRNKTLKFLFDVPSGDYSVVSRFTAN